MNRNIHSQMQSQIRNIFYFWVTSELQIEKLTPNFELHKKLSRKMTSLREREKKKKNLLQLIVIKIKLALAEFFNIIIKD